MTDDQFMSIFHSIDLESELILLQIMQKMFRNAKSPYLEIKSAGSAAWGNHKIEQPEWARFVWTT